MSSTGKSGKQPRRSCHFTGRKTTTGWTKAEKGKRKDGGSGGQQGEGLHQAQGEAEPPQGEACHRRRGQEGLRLDQGHEEPAFVIVEEDQEDGRRKIRAAAAPAAPWRSGYAADCKSAYPGSSPGGACLNKPSLLTERGFCFPGGFAPRKAACLVAPGCLHPPARWLRHLIGPDRAWAYGSLALPSPPVRTRMCAWRPFLLR